jgi:phage terminase small subunit
MKTKKQIIADVDEAVKYKYRKLKTDVINLITSKGQLEKIDINMIDELIFNYRIIDKLKKELLAGGIIVNVRTPEAIPLYQTSSYMSIYNNCLKNILAISRQLGITVSERAKLGLNNISTEIEDGF